MEMKSDEFQTLQLRVDRISSELDKKNAIQAVNTKWLITVGAIILASLGFTSFVQLPKEASRAATQQVGIQIQDRAKEIISDLEKYQKTAREIEAGLTRVSEIDKIANLPIGTIIPSMLNESSFAETVADPTDFDSEKSKWVLADGRNVDGSEYAGKVKPQLPDLRGMFLRGMNEGRTDGDPDQDRQVGSYQADAFAKHDHNLKFHYRSFKGDGGKGRPALDEGTSPKPVTPIQGNRETRPKNVAVYFYIKIN